MAHEWKVGDEVVMQGSGYWGQISAVSAVYKTGNVLITARGKQQFKPYGDDLLVETTRVCRECWRLLSDETRAMIDAHRAETSSCAEARELSDRLAIMAGYRRCSSHAEAIRALLSAIKGKE